MRPSAVGTWRSLVAHLHGVQGVASSNLAVPTNHFPIQPLPRAAGIRPTPAHVMSRARAKRWVYGPFDPVLLLYIAARFAQTPFAKNKHGGKVQWCRFSLVFFALVSLCSESFPLRRPSRVSSRWTSMAPPSRPIPERTWKTAFGSRRTVIGTILRAPIRTAATGSVGI